MNQIVLFQFQRHPVLEKDLYCSWLHHEDPFLRLAPFKLEVLHNKPQIGIVREFASKQELSRIKRQAQGHMKSTPYVTGTTEKAYSKLRTSKVMYMNELYPVKVGSTGSVFDPEDSRLKS